MTDTQAARELAALPPKTRRVVFNLISMLRALPGPDAAPRKAKRPPLEREKFIGMWRDREDMADSTEWLRSLRGREWKRA